MAITDNGNKKSPLLRVMEGELDVDEALEMIRAVLTI